MINVYPVGALCALIPTKKWKYKFGHFLFRVTLGDRGFDHAQNMEDERSPERETRPNRHGPSDDTLGHILKRL